MGWECIFIYLICCALKVEQIQDDSRKLQAAYAGDKAKEITNREAEVVNAWMNLQGNFAVN